MKWSASGAAVVGATPSLLRRNGGLSACPLFRLNDPMRCHAMYVYPHGMVWHGMAWHPHACMHGYIQTTLGSNESHPCVALSKVDGS